MNEDSVTRMIPLGDDPGAPAGGSGAQVVVLEGLRPGQVLELKDPEARIGRRLDNDLVLESPAVSKYHARILKVGAGFAVEDLGSTNGVLVNGHRIGAQSRHQLCHGDTIVVSDHLLLFRQAGSFTDRRGMSTISFDPGAVKKEVDALMAQIPDLKNVARAPRRRGPKAGGE
jgi:pSer/pThr/pTyr-binding forkhead associated (FHA) protein